MPSPSSDGARRRRQRQAVLGAAEDAPERGRPALAAVIGTIVDASPHLLVLATGGPGAGAGAATTGTVPVGGAGIRNGIGAANGMNGAAGGHGSEAGTDAGAEAAASVAAAAAARAAGGVAAATGDTTEVRLPMTPQTSVWYGGRAGLPALRPGRQVIVRPSADAPGADRIWVDIVRVTGTIISHDRGVVEVDAGPHRGRTHAIIPKHAMARVLVRHPRMEPGYLIDLLCVRSADGPRAARPGTSQPGHLAGRVPAAPPGARAPRLVQGTATWFGAPMDTLDARGMPRIGAAYPALDPEGDAGGCPDAPAGCVALPYLSRGSHLLVHNDCTQRAEVVPVIECGCVAARYCDRCVECGTSPRGRVVELTPAAFVGLGGDLDAGCFNTTVTTGW